MIDYKNPHQVMLFFKQTDCENRLHNDGYLKQQRHYYEDLKAVGKVTISGDLYDQSRIFVILNVSCDSELEEIISNDPCIRQNRSELVRAMPFVEV